MKIVIDQLEKSKKYIEDQILYNQSQLESSIEYIENTKSIINDHKKQLQQLELAIKLLKGNTNDSQSKKINGKR